MIAPFATSIIFSIITGKLTKFFDKKKILIIGLLIYSITGILPSFATSMTQIILLRLLTGIGVGLVIPLTNMIIVQFYVSPKRERMLGLSTSVANAANVLVSIVVGVLLVFSWKFTFYSFICIGVVLLICLFGIPKLPPIEKKETRENNTVKAKLPKVTWALALAMAFVWLLFAFSTTNIALFMAEEKIGAAWMTGVAIAMPGLASMLAGALFPEFRKMLKRLFVPIGMFLFGLGFVLLCIAQSAVLIIIGALLIGFGSGVVFPYILDLVAIKVEDPVEREMAYGIVTPCMHLGILISPFLQEIILVIGKTTSYRLLFLVAAIVLILAAVISLLIKPKSTVSM